MHNNIKVLYLAILLCVTTLSFPSAAEDEISESLLYEQIKESVNKKTMMQTKRWNTPDYDADKNSEKEDAKDDEKKENDEANTDDEEENLTQRQKIWNKYKKLAEDAKKNKEESSKDSEDENNSEDKDADDTKTSGSKDDQSTESQEETAEESTVEENKEPTGIAGILKRYKDAQETKGTLNSRSFGSID